MTSRPSLGRRQASYDRGDDVRRVNRGDPEAPRHLDLRHREEDVLRRFAVRGFGDIMSPVDRLPGGRGARIDLAIQRRPGELLGRSEAMVARIPRANMRLHVCLCADDGIVWTDTCPTREAEAFAAGGFPALRERHNLPERFELRDFPVNVAFVDGVAR